MLQDKETQTSHCLLSNRITSRPNKVSHTVKHIRIRDPYLQKKGKCGERIPHGRGKTTLPYDGVYGRVHACSRCGCEVDAVEEEGGVFLD